MQEFIMILLLPIIFYDFKIILKGLFQKAKLHNGFIYTLNLKIWD